MSRFTISRQFTISRDKLQSNGIYNFTVTYPCKNDPSKCTLFWFSSNKSYAKLQMFCIEMDSFIRRLCKCSICTVNCSDLCKHTETMYHVSDKTWFSWISFTQIIQFIFYFFYWDSIWGKCIRDYVISFVITIILAYLLFGSRM